MAKTGPTHPSADEQWAEPHTSPKRRIEDVLRRQKKALQRELNTISGEYEQALCRINELEAERFERVSEESGTHTARLVKNLETREQFYKRKAQVLAKTRRVLEDEMVTAGSVQRLFVPESPPHDVPGVELAISYTSASKTSGDLYGFRHEQDRGILDLFIADATGHGLPAALITAGVFGAMEALRFVGARDSLIPTLDAVVGAMANRKLAMTFFSATFDYRRFRLHYSNAGHCFPLIVRGGEARSLAQSELQLGMGGPRESDGRRHAVALADGDVLLLYTDGLTEACNARGRAVGTRRLSEWLQNLHTQPVDVIRDGLASRLEHFAGTTPIDDDVTFLVARFCQ